MKKFNFRLQRVLEYRQLLEQWAKEAYLESRSARLMADLEMLGIQEERSLTLDWRPDSITGMRSLEQKLRRLDEAEVEQQIAINALLHEEGQALEAWTDKKIEVEALTKLYDKQYEEWKLDVERHVQAELDEWAVQKRAA